MVNLVQQRSIKVNHGQTHSTLKNLVKDVYYYYFIYIIFFLLANMELLFYLHTIPIHRSTFPAGILGNRAVLTSPETFKNCSAGKPELEEFYKIYITD